MLTLQALGLMALCSKKGFESPRFCTKKGSTLSLRVSKHFQNPQQNCFGQVIYIDLDYSAGLNDDCHWSFGCKWTCEVVQGGWIFSGSMRKNSCFLVHRERKYVLFHQANIASIQCDLPLSFPKRLGFKVHHIKKHRQKKNSTLSPPCSNVKGLCHQ